MSNIGSFKKVGNEYHGKISTLALKADNVRIVPEAKRSSESAPSHRVFAGSAEIGAAWPRQSNKGGNDYLSVKLQDPMIPTKNNTIFANLVATSDGGYGLIWSPPAATPGYQRQSPSNDQAMPEPDGAQARAGARSRVQPKPNSKPEVTG